MRKHATLFAALAGLIVGAHAAGTGTTDATRAPLACGLLKPEDLAGTGYAPIAPQGTSVRLAADQAGAPSDLQAELCFHYQDAERRHVVHVTVETFEKADGLAQWVEAKNRLAASDGAQTVTIGEVTCERGDYAQKLADGTRTQHYLTCDRLVGRRRVGVGFEAPDRADGLPTDAAALQALAAIVSRLPAD